MEHGKRKTGKEGERGGREGRERKRGGCRVPKEGSNYSGVGVKRRLCGPLERGFSLSKSDPPETAVQCMPSGCSPVRLFATLWTAARQAPLCVGVSSQGHRALLPRPPPGDLLDPGIEPASFMSPALTGRFFTTSATWEAQAIQ